MAKNTYMLIISIIAFFFLNLMGFLVYLNTPYFYVNKKGSDRDRTVIALFISA